MLQDALSWQSRIDVHVVSLHEICVKIWRRVIVSTCSTNLRTVRSPVQPRPVRRTCCRAAVGSAQRRPGAPAASSSESIEQAWPTLIVATHSLTHGFASYTWHNVTPPPCELMQVTAESRRYSLLSIASKSTPGRRLCGARWTAPHGCGTGRASPRIFPSAAPVLTVFTTCFSVFVCDNKGR